MPQTPKGTVFARVPFGLYEQVEQERKRLNMTLQAFTQRALEHEVKQVRRRNRRNVVDMAPGAVNTPQTRLRRRSAERNSGAPEGP